ncbi:MAG: type II/IV secretion system protein [Pirellulaceae bacterium]|nr:type II/IV secretion system protein [Pirellulaceae bacterium]
MSTAEVIDFQAIPLANLEPSQAVRALIEQAVELKASDLFLLSDETGLRVAIRHMGHLETLATVSREQGRTMITFLKAQAGMDIADRRRPQEGRWIFEREGDRIDLRLNIIPTLHGEDLAARILDRKLGLRTLDSLGLTRTDHQRLASLLSSPSGLILVTGPTGTGKTTTLYACLQHLNNGSRKINTLEDPVEYQLPGIRQSEVKPRLSVDFPEMLRNVLRQAPDVIMVGEIRDEETAATAVRAANSGHLVLATLHAPVAAGAVQSMRALNSHPYFLASCLLGVVAQRLVRKLCPNCRTAYDISESPDTFAEVQGLLEPGLGTFIYGPSGCDQCRNQGYKGQVGVFELMTFNRELRKMVLASTPMEDLQKQAIASGMVEFRRSAMLKIAQGLTSTEEVLRELPAEYLGLEM